MPQTDIHPPVDPRIRRTRARIAQALSDLLKEKSFAEISITDLTKRADVARVTFYQHFDGKEAVLLRLVSQFFEQMYAALEPDHLEQLMSSGIPDELEGINAALLPDPTQLHLIHVALKHTSSAVRQLAIQSFLKSLRRSQIVEDEAAARLLGTYHVSGVLALLEGVLDQTLDISPQQMGGVTLQLLHSLLNEAQASGTLARGLNSNP